MGGLWRQAVIGAGRSVRLCVLAALLAAAGCATASEAKKVDVTLLLNAESYQKGEPVFATVRVWNRAAEEVIIPALASNTLTFYGGQRGSGIRTRHRPVLPESLPAQPRLVRPGQAASRRFVFTRLTQEAGEWALVVGLSGHRLGKREAPPLPTSYAKLAQFTVAESVLLERDPYSGIVTADQAVALAREHSGHPSDLQGRAVLVPIGETGLHFWAVFLGGTADSIEEATGFRVNPYTGAVEPLELKQTQEEGDAS